MDDVILKKRLDDTSILYVTTLDSNTYEEVVESDTLGGSVGYFVIRAVREGTRERLEVLAKASSFAAAGQLFDLIEPVRLKA